METKKKKKTGKLIAVIIAILVAAALSYSVLFGGSDEVGAMSFSTEAAPESITIKWDRHSKVDYYELYRTDISYSIDTGTEGPLAFEEYKKIATTDSDKSSYVDEYVEPGHTYAYEIAGFRESFGKTKQVCASYSEDSITYETVGLMRPQLLNGGYGEFYTNSRDKLYLYVESYGGLEPEGAELYRKSAGSKSYKKINYKHPEDGMNQMLDDTVKPGETYSYKARTYTVVDGKKYYSEDSKEVTIPAVDFNASYDVKSVDGTADTFVIKVTGGQYNGVTTFDSDEPAKYIVVRKGHDQQYTFGARLIAYSKSSGSGQWEPVPEKGVSIGAGESVYLRYELSEWNGLDDETNPDDAMFFGGSAADESRLMMDGDGSGGATYHGPGLGQTIMELDLVKGKGSAYCDWDQ